MNILKKISTILRWRLWQKKLPKKLVKKKLPPEKLPPEIMARVMTEIRFLRDSHAVDVRAIVDGEDTNTAKKVDE